MARPAHDVVRLAPEHADEVRRLDQAAFVSAQEYLQLDLGFLEWGRVAGVRAADGRLVGLRVAYTFGMSVPAGPEGGAVGELAVAALSWVGVDPGHRRRGILRTMITEHLHGLHEGREGGEAVSALHASEPSIYQRFGYGLATNGLRLTLGRAPALHPVAGSEEVEVSFDTADVERDLERLNAVYLHACAQRPGMMRRSAAHAVAELSDLAVARGDVEPKRVLFARRGGRDTGYAVVRRKADWGRTGPAGSTDVHELVALDAPTAHALWSRVTDFDLITTTRTPSLSPDDRLLHLLVDARGAGATRGDDLWLRLVDVDRALAGRTYGREVDVVLDVTDALCPWNARRWRLSGGPDGATCAPTSDPADVALDVKQLGAVYVGGTTLAALADADLVTEHTPGAVGRLSAALRAPVEPWSGWVF